MVELLICNQAVVGSNPIASSILEAMNPIKEWHEIVKSGNTEKLSTLIDQDCIFYSPVVFTPQEGKEITLKYLSAAALVFGDESFCLLYTSDAADE